MSRGFGYNLTRELFGTSGGWPFNNFELHKRTAVERLKPVFGFGEVLYIPPIYLEDELINNPVGWLKKQMKQYVNQGDE